MSTHWKVALRCAALACGGAVIAGAVVWSRFGTDQAGAFAYGVAVGLVGFISVAFTVSMLSGSSPSGWMVIGAISFVGRCVFAGLALGVPAYFEMWPTVAMICGFAGVYIVENAALLPMMPKRLDYQKAKR